MKAEQFLTLLKVPATLAGKPVDNARRLQAMNARLFGLGFGVPCSRCGGTGHYSFNQINGTRCFKCGGAKFEAPKLTRELFERVSCAVQAGELDKYLENVRARQAAEKAAKGAVDAVMRAWHDSGVSEAYDWQKARDMEPHRTLARDINAPMCAAYESVREAEKIVNNLTFKLNGGARNAKALSADERAEMEAQRAQALADLIAARDAALATIAEKAALIPGILAKYKKV